MLIQEIRARLPDRGGTISAIALTAYAGEFDRQKALQAHLTKPVKPEVLVRAIARLCGGVEEQGE